MASGSIKFEGGAELVRKLRQLGDDAQGKTLVDAVRAGAVVMRDEARSFAPAETGRLKNNIIATAGRNKDRSEAAAFMLVRKLTSKQVSAFKRKTGLPATKNPRDAYYWKFLEFGTSKMSARPFIRKAFDTAKEKVVKAITDKLGTTLEKALSRK